jgi:hypothetical protein
MVAYRIVSQLPRPCLLELFFNFYFFGHAWPKILKGLCL